MKCGARFGVAINDRIRHSKERGHHRFGPRIPEIAVVFDNAGINLHVPIWNIDIADVLDLPEVEFAVGPVQSENSGRKIVLQIRFQRRISQRRIDRLVQVERDVIDQQLVVAGR